MLSSPKIMPLNVAEFLTETAGMHPAEVGALVRLRIHHWQHGTIPAQESHLARIVGVSRPEWLVASKTLEPLFESANGCWLRGDWDDDLLLASQKHARAKARSAKAHTVKRTKNVSKNTASSVATSSATSTQNLLQASLQAVLVAKSSEEFSPPKNNRQHTDLKGYLSQIPDKENLTVPYRECNNVIEGSVFPCQSIRKLKDASVTHGLARDLGFSPGQGGVVGDFEADIQIAESAFGLVIGGGQ